MNRITIIIFLFLGIGATFLTDAFSQREESKGRDGHNKARANQQRGGERRGADTEAIRKGIAERLRSGADMESIRKGIEERVKKGIIKREEAGKMLEGLRKRAEGARRGQGNEKKGRKDDSLEHHMNELRQNIRRSQENGDQRKAEELMHKLRELEEHHEKANHDGERHEREEHDGEEHDEERQLHEWARGMENHMKQLHRRIDEMSNVIESMKREIERLHRDRYQANRQ
ncbi:hypothetical protein OAF35_06475, partial [Verrucomicrobiales bacterium]|nr:hypothetical protein [Verrucomicrobiales bacterium]